MPQQQRQNQNQANKQKGKLMNTKTQKPTYDKKQPKIHTKKPGNTQQNKQQGNNEE